MKVTAEVEIAEKGGASGASSGGSTASPSPWRMRRRRRHPGRPSRFTRAIALDEGDNEIEVVAYNSQNLIASMPARAIVTGQAALRRARRRASTCSRSASTTTPMRSLKLAYALPDALGARRSAQQGGKGPSTRMWRSRWSRTSNVNRERLGGVHSTISPARCGPTDVFAFFIAGHGKTIDGRYYFIPRDFSACGAREPSGRARDAASHAGDRAGAMAGVVRRAFRRARACCIFDTCESGTLTGDGRETQSCSHAAPPTTGWCRRPAAPSSPPRAEMPTRSKATAGTGCSPTTF